VAQKTAKYRPQSVRRSRGDLRRARALPIALMDSAAWWWLTAC